MIMIVPVLRTKPSGLYRHRRGLGLHRVGYREGDLTSESPSLPSTQRRVPSGYGTKSSILYIHSPTVRHSHIVRLSEDPLIQDSLSDHLTELLQDHGFEIGKIEPTLFNKKVKRDLFVCQLYVDDIIFGSPNKAFNEEFATLMTSKFKMSSM